MRLNLFERLLQVPTVSCAEGRMVDFLQAHVKARGVKRCGQAFSDRYNNVYIIKGSARYYPCLAAHIDTVHPVDQNVAIQREDDIFVGYDAQGQRAGIGADNKTGITVCLEMLERLDSVAIMLFAAEEVGCRGAFNAAPEFFDLIGYLLEWDAPSNNLFSYTSRKVRLFENEGEFIRRALPELQKRKMLWQNHPYTDVMAIRQVYPISCMNLSSGYYNWHQPNEYARISEMEGAIELAADLVTALDSQRYEFPVKHGDRKKPLVEVGPLVVSESTTRV